MAITKKTTSINNLLGIPIFKPIANACMDRETIKTMRYDTKMNSSMPKKIQIGPFVYSVKCDDAAKTVLNSDHGETDGARLEIRINPDSADLVQREVLLHESLHAIAAVAGLDHELGEELEEKIVRRIAPVLFDALLRNPKLVDYLLGTA